MISSCDFAETTTRPWKVRQHFVDGETFGIYGEILPAQAARPEVSN